MTDDTYGPHTPGYRYGEFSKLQRMALEELKKFSTFHTKSQAIINSVPDLIILLTKYMEEASHALGVIGDRRAVEPMIEAFRTSDMQSVVVARVLSRFKDERAIAPLLEALLCGLKYAVDMLDKCDNNWPQTETAMNAVPDLIEALDNAETSELAFAALERIGDMNAVESMFNAIKNSNIWNPIGIDSLEKLYPDWTTSEMAKNSVSELISINSSGSVLLLGEIGGPRAVEFLIDRLLSDSRFYGNQDALIKIGKPAVQSLIDVLVDDSDPSYLAAMVLGEIGDAQAVTPLISSLGYSHRDYEEPDSFIPYVIEALGKIGDARAIAPLLEELKRERIYYEINISLKNILRASIDKVDLDILVKLANLENDFSLCKIEEPKYDWDLHSQRVYVPLPLNEVIEMASKEIERRRR